MLREKITSVFIGILIFSFTLSSCIGCISAINSSQKIIKTTTGQIIKKDNTLFPIKSFVMTSQNFRVTTKVCENKNQCTTAMLGTFNSVASGVIIKTDTPNSYILTAGHVCMPPPPTSSVAGEVSISYHINVVTGFGRKSKAIVEAVDIDNDLCLLSSQKYLGPGLVLQSTKTKLHSKVYNMASPAGLAAPIAVPVFDGYYIGTVLNRMLFTIPAAPGSSGSPIMNDKNEIITVVSAAAINFDEFAICPKTDEISKFILASVPVKRKNTLLDKAKIKLFGKRN